MAHQVPAKDDPIIIVGAGIFGLSTSLHLAGRGYRNVTVFDRQAYDDTLYSYFKGCDAASADMNKIIRSAYGTQTEYQELGFEAVEAWKQWNDELSSGQVVPPGMSQSDKVFHNNGTLSFNEGDSLPPFEIATLKAMEEAGRKDTQLVTTDPRHVALAEQKGLAFAMDPFKRKARGKSQLGVLDSSGGMAIADQACRFALHKARLAGVRFIFGPMIGAFEALTYGAPGGASENVTGIRTRDGKTHRAALTIMACGGWTPTLVPHLDGLCEATGGSVILIKIPEKSPLYSRFAPERFPTWLYRMRDGAEGGLYGFPRDERGYLKIGYRGSKYTNPQTQKDGAERSVPVTRYTEGEKLTQIPKQALKVVKGFLAEYLPEIAEEGLDISLTRVCWYTDTFDNHFVVDCVPGHRGLMVATGGSGHAFKYLPVVGNLIADIIEGKGLDRPIVQAWKWRKQGQAHPVNVLMEGKKGVRALQNTQLTSDADMRLGAGSNL